MAYLAELAERGVTVTSAEREPDAENGADIALGLGLPTGEKMHVNFPEVPVEWLQHPDDFRDEWAEWEEAVGEGPEIFVLHHGDCTWGEAVEAAVRIAQASKGPSGPFSPRPSWTELLAHEPSRARYAAKVHRRGPDECWYWLGAFSTTGHGRFEVGREDGPLLGVSACAYGYQLANGVTARRPGRSLEIGHRCEEASCLNPSHLELIERTQEDARRQRPNSPPADARGAHGRAVAIREAINEARRTGADIEAAIATATAAGFTEINGSS